jgi:hypothetical protein
VAPAGLLEIRNEFVISDNGLPDEVSPRAEQCPIDSLPGEALVYLLGSRYCDTEKLSQLAWQQFGSIVGGWQRVKAICDYVHSQLEFGYHHARPDRIAVSFNSRSGLVETLCSIVIPPATLPTCRLSQQ